MGTQAQGSPKPQDFSEAPSAPMRFRRDRIVPLFWGRSALVKEEKGAMKYIDGFQ